MKKANLIIFLLLIISTPAQAEVFKCKLASGKIVYQSKPCPRVAIDQNIIEIKKLSPAQIEEAQNKLKAWQAEQAANEEAKIKAAKELQEEIERQETINALNRNAIAQQQQAIAAQRQAEALEQRNNSNTFFYNGPFYGRQFYPPKNYWPPYTQTPNPNHLDWEHRHETNQGPQHNPGTNRSTHPQHR
jgi:hypothetical protein